jgi:hypothetical protein
MPKRDSTARATSTLGTPSGPRSASRSATLRIGEKLKEAKISVSRSGRGLDA